MSRPRVSPTVPPDDLYITPEPLPRIGRPPEHDRSVWTVEDDWPKRMPVMQVEADVFEASFGVLFDDRRAIYCAPPPARSQPRLQFAVLFRNGVPRKTRKERAT
jgi:hypothetical protein